MTNFKICLICLISEDVKMYNLNDFNLKLYYEQVVANTVLEGLPQTFCYQCAAMLYKFHKFKEKCHTGLLTLNELLSNGLLTVESISQVDRERKHLKSSIDITKLLNTDSRIRNTYQYNIYNIDDEELTYSVKIEPLSAAETNFDYENLPDFKNIAECKVEIKETETKIDDRSLNSDTERTLSLQCLSTKCKSTENANTDLESTPFNIDSKSVYEGSPRTTLKQTCYILNSPQKRLEANNKIVKKKIKNHNENIETGNKNIRKDIVRSKRKPRDKKSDTIHKRTQKKRFGAPRQKHLNPEHWLKISMTEEEAMDNFKAKSQEPKYVAAVHKCDKCYTGYSKEDILRRHTKLVHCESRGSFICHFCSRRFRNKSLLTKHKPVHYHKFKCLRCDLVFPLEASAYNHDDLHSGLYKKCEKCGMQFRHRTSYYSHVRVSHRSEHVCTLCGASFISQKGLMKHKNYKHMDDDLNSEETGETTYCVKCDLEFVTREAYEEHFHQSVKHADVPAEDVTDESISVGDTQVNASLKSKIVRPGMKRSKYRETTTCFVCEKKFPSYFKYRKHHRAEHKDIPIPIDRTQMCEVCGATIKCNTIAVHMNIHTRENIFPCQTCGMQFTLKTNMRRHMLTHTVREKLIPKHKCPLCEKKYTEKGSMMVHYRTVHLKEPCPKRKGRKADCSSKIYEN